MAVRSPARQVGLRVRSAVRPADALPRRSYMHCFIQEGGIQSRLHLHHFYSLFVPDLHEAGRAHVTLRDGEGAVIGTTTRIIEPFGMSLVPVTDLLREFGSSQPFGSVEADFEPGPRTAEALVALAPETWALTPFWMSVLGEDGSIGYVHSIDQRHGHAYGVSWPISWAWAAWSRSREPWESRRLIPVTGLETADAYFVNYRPRRGRTLIRWEGHPGHHILAEHTVSTAGLGVSRVRLTSKDLDTVPGSVTHVQLRAERLNTPNGKPYILTRYRGGPFAFHHG